MTASMTGAGRSAAWMGAALGGVALHVAAAAVILRAPAPPPQPVDSLVVELVTDAPTSAPDFAVPDSPLPQVDPQVQIDTPQPQPVETAQALPELPQPDDLTPPQPDPLPDPAPLPEPPPDPVDQPMTEAPPITPPMPEPPAPEPPTEIALPDLPQLPDLAPLPPVASDVAVAPARPRSRPQALLQEPEPEPEIAREEPKREPRREAAKPDPEPRRQRAEPTQAQSQAKAEAAAQAKAKAKAQAQAQAKAQAAAGARASSQATANWQARVQLLAARHMSRARKPRGGGFTATLSIRIDGAGRVGGVSLTRGSGDPRIDSALMSHARRLPKMPAPPDGQSRTIVAPFRIQG